MHSKHEQSKKHKMHDKREDRETAIFGIDAKTRIILYKMINNELLDRVNGVISIGKSYLNSILSNILIDLCYRKRSCCSSC